MATSSPTVAVQIDAKVSGKESVSDLTDRLDDMAKVLEGDLQQQAQAAARKLRELAQQQEAISALERLKREATLAGAALKSAETEAENFGRQVGQAGPPTAREAEALQRLQAAAEAARVHLQQQKVALAQSTSELQRHGIAAQNAREAQQRLAAEIDQVRESVVKLGPAHQAAAERAAAAGVQIQRTHRAVGEGVASISTQLQRVQNVMIALQGGGFLGGLVKDLAQTADEYTALSGRIGLAAGEGRAFEAAMAGVQRVAIDTRSDLEATGTLVTKLIDSGKAAGLSQQQALNQALDLTRTINQSIQITGGGAEAAKAAITQLTQGLQSGVLRGDEFNSVMEQAPRLAQAMADGLGVTKGELRAMAEQGALTAETVTRALRLQSDAVAAEFSKLPPTIGSALQNLSTSWTIYVGNADKASGASKAAAEAIGYLAKHLSTIANYLVDAGQAVAAFTALRLAQHFLGIGQAAQTAASQVAGATAALKGAEAAATGAAAGAGRFAMLLGGLKTFTLVGIISNFKDIGTWIGETTAKLMGYKDRTAELAAEEALQNKILQERQALRQMEIDRAKQQENALYGLSKAGVALIAKFDEMRKGGTLAAEAIDKIGKDFDLASQPGIRDAVAVMDKLQADGKITAEQFQQAWAKALDGADLRNFETVAKAALQGTKREAEQLAQVMDVTLHAAIQRTGLDMQLISGGMSTAAASAINDTDRLIEGFDRLKSQGLDAGRVLSTSFVKAIDTADSQRAIDVLNERIQASRKLLGDDIANGLLEKTRARAIELRQALDDITPGINSLDEAMRKLGLKSIESLRQTADEGVAAYSRIKTEGQAEGESFLAWQARKEAAAKAMIQKLIDANQGVADESIKTRAAIEGLEVTTDSAGKAMVRGMNDAANATRGAGKAANEAAGQFSNMAAAAQRAAAAASGIDGSGMNSFANGVKKPSTGLTGGPVDFSLPFNLYGKQQNGTLTVNDLAAARNALQAAKNNARLGQPGSVSLEGMQEDQVWIGRLQRIVDELEALQPNEAAIGGKPPGFAPPPEPAPVPIPAPVPAPAPAPIPIPGQLPSPTPITINLPDGRSTRINVAGKTDAQALQRLLDELVAAASRTGS